MGLQAPETCHRADISPARCSETGVWVSLWPLLNERFRALIPFDHRGKVFFLLSWLCR